VTEGTHVQVKPLRRARWLPGVVYRCDGDVVTVMTQERMGAVWVHRWFTVPADRVRVTA